MSMSLLAKKKEFKPYKNTEFEFINPKYELRRSKNKSTIFDSTFEEFLTHDHKSALSLINKTENRGSGNKLKETLNKNLSRSSSYTGIKIDKSLNRRKQRLTMNQKVDNFNKIKDFQKLLRQVNNKGQNESSDNVGYLNDLPFMKKNHEYPILDNNIGPSPYSILYTKSIKRRKMKLRSNSQEKFSMLPNIPVSKTDKKL
eukprot:CAMPEP_0205825318 /NCGR_PEP_ID=MMETSP0206-20130828/24723_1 /ASSEMBLY_ACC=CAM_ASM_000279 /TAXON_ID=36767 /ORGANISM="Euplotes focardii, Strain TN1" /LENGTH=199 /DNA_ID=CAMNT_0053124263 /DNA_START=68 /DNA_END=667 /DNA_ORIENTATION=+